jgi:hypothetical protein
MQARETITAENGRLCATPFGVDVVGITEVVALTGALVGGAQLRVENPCLECCCTKHSSSAAEKGWCVWSSPFSNICFLRLPVL